VLPATAAEVAAVSERVGDGCAATAEAVVSAMGGGVVSAAAVVALAWKRIGGGAVATAVQQQR
jgi:hypothetical protein